MPDPNPQEQIPPAVPTDADPDDLAPPPPALPHEDRCRQLAEAACFLLNLPPLSLDVLCAFLPLELDGEVAAAQRAEDPHNRPGVLSWVNLLDLVGDLDYAPQLEDATAALADWGLLQVVGALPTDPPVPGAAALRLTHAGRVALGLSPASRAHFHSGDLSPWRVLHGASRESLLIEAWALLGGAGPRPDVQPLALSLRPDPLDHWCGGVAQQLVCRGAALVDGFALVGGDNTAAQGATLLEPLLRRTALARLPRLLLLPDPAAARVAAWATGAILRWVEPRVETRRQGLLLDDRMTAALASGRRDGRVAADLTGVPDSELATPRRVSTAWQDLLLPSNVELEFQQALMHARFRLGDDASGRPGGRPLGYRLLLSGLPGTGKSMAAEALATTLDRPLVKLDLSSVLSKWLGETEKLMAQVFDVAESAGAVLVLDEAESLLRQRESGGQGNNALATGVAYLLTRLERYTGLLVATTNRTKDLDEAFFRRFDDYIVLPVPDAPTRTRLWRLHLGLGEADGGLDLSFIAHQFAISGGLIRGASLRARAWALGMGQALQVPIVLASLGRELEKSDRSAAEVFVEPYAEEVRRMMRGPDAPPREAPPRARDRPRPGRR